LQSFRTILASTALLGVVACSSTITTPNTPVPQPGPSGGSTPAIKHIVILFQENRSFNSMFMGFPGAVTARSGACKPWQPPKQWGAKEVCPKGVPVQLKEITLETNSQPGGFDIGHEHWTFLSEFDGGKMDGFDTDFRGTTGNGPPARRYPYAYVKQSELKPYWDMASQYTLADHMFSTETSDSFPAHQMIIAGTTELNDHESLIDEPSSLTWGCDASPGTTTPYIIKSTGKIMSGPNGIFPCFDQYKTMADSLDAANVSWHYYVQPLQGQNNFAGGVWDAFDAIKHVRYGSDWKTHVINPETTVLKDAANGTLPSVSWVIPSLLNSDHPASGCRNGPTWVSQVVDAIGKGPDWNSTAIIVTWDEWGGFYDPVPPPQLDYVSLGIRIPMIIISPYSKRHYVSKTQYEFGSILKFIEQTFNAPSLGATDDRANSIADSFDFTQKPLAFKPIAIPAPMKCQEAPAEEIERLDGGVPN
jgi:phospholipase C